MALLYKLRIRFIGVIWLSIALVACERGGLEEELVCFTLDRSTLRVINNSPTDLSWFAASQDELSVIFWIPTCRETEKIEPGSSRILLENLDTRYTVGEVIVVHWWTCTKDSPNKIYRRELSIPAKNREVVCQVFSE